MHRSAAILTIVLANGCIFGGAATTNNDDNGETDMQVSPDGASGDMGSSDMVTETLQYGPADEETIDCEPKASTFVDVRLAPDNFVIDSNSAIGTTGAAGVIGGAQVPNAVAWVKPTDEGVRVVVAGYDGGTPTVTPAEYWTGTIPESASVSEVFGITLTAKLYLVGGRDQVKYEVFAMTDAGVWTCGFANDLAANPFTLEMSCKRDLQDVLDSVDVGAATSTDFVPIMQQDGEKYIFRLLDTRLLFGASGVGPLEKEYLALASSSGAALMQHSTTAAIQGSLTPPELFAQRLALGVTEETGGWPAAMVLARDPSGDGYGPRVLRNPDGDGTYEPFETAPWPLSPRIDLSNRRFTFLDGYQGEVEVRALGLEYAINPTGSELFFGYAGLSSSGDTLYLSVPGGIVGNDVLEFQTDGQPVEIAAFRNIPLNPDISENGFPYIAVVSGDSRDRLTLLQWEFRNSVASLADALRGRFTDVRQISATNFVNGAGQIGFRAVEAESDTLGIGIFHVGEEQDEKTGEFAATVCQP